MPVIVDVQYAYSGQTTPDKKRIENWVNAALYNFRSNAEITIRIVDENEGMQLNKKWRNANGPTNVLSFPTDGLDDIAPELLGDVVICAPIIEKEATQQMKNTDAHWAHMVVHGTLHLLGYDHIESEEAKEMEQLEISILEKLGFINPYI